MNEDKDLETVHKEAQAYGRALHNSCDAQRSEAAYEACPTPAWKQTLKESKMAAEDTYGDLDATQRVRLAADLKRVAKGEVSVAEINNQASKDVFAAGIALRRSGGR